MNIKLPLTLLLVCVAFSLSAQRKSSVNMVYGVAAGAIYPVVETSSGASIDLSGDVGFKAGIMFGVNFGIVEFVPELWYSSFNVNLKQAGVDKRTELNSKNLDMPLLVGLRIAKPIKVHLGPTISLMCNNKFTQSDGVEMDYGRIKSNVGYVVGVSYDVFRNIFVDFRYVGRFTTYKSEWENSSYNVSMYTLDLTAGFRF